MAATAVAVLSAAVAASAVAVGDEADRLDPKTDPDIVHNKWSGPDPVQNGLNQHQCQGTATRRFSDKSVEFFFKAIITVFSEVGIANFF